MAKIFLYLALDGPFDQNDDPQNPGVYTARYEPTRYEFDTVTKQASGAREADVLYTGGYQGAPPPPESSGISTTTAFYDDCAGTTKRDFFHNGNGTFRIEREENSSACGYTPPPVAGTVLRHECRGLDRYRIVADGAGGETAILVQKNSPTCGYAPPAPVPGCMDTEATNYNANATEDNGTCVYTPRLDVSTLPRLAAVGVPLLFTVQSAETGQASVRARLLLTVASLVAGTVLTLQGETFTAVATNPGPGQFASAATLATVLASSVTLSARYRVSQPDATSVELVALAEGSQFTPQASTSDEQGGLTLQLTAGVDGLRSQTKKEWGCYVEIWAVPEAAFGGAVNLSSAYLVDRLEQLYRTGNRYTFDLSPALLPLVGHSRTTSTDRLVAYFVRFGEMYIPEGEQLRRRLVVADTDVCFGLESAVPVPPLATRLSLSVPMPQGRVPVGRASYPERVYLLAEAGATVRAQLDTRSATGVLSTQSVQAVAAGGVHTLALGGLLSQLPAEALFSNLTLQVNGQPVGGGRYQHAPARACLHFLSRRGAYETIWLLGLTEPAPKRSAQLYSRGTSQAVRRVELEPVRKLASGPLTRGGLDWLCDELATSPEVYLLDEQLEPVVVTGFSPDYNEPENTYSLTLDVVPAPPTYTLSN
ncbi:hypothetical protein [Hymenobacter metallilatus]|uniref:Uncharacterized protein n=1 Tax=Hymenobacter metallilatus TaxID=2493666 RepID=A0A428JLX7_9BACT|nr:hypothetical protein [Hymenobacter metallilatus]RSK33953.1 hypothetical protein EI290_09615 [Hymenobacter metallilatus]